MRERKRKKRKTQVSRLERESAVSLLERALFVFALSLEFIRGGRLAHCAALAGARALVAPPCVIKAPQESKKQKRKGSKLRRKLQGQKKRKEKETIREGASKHNSSKLALRNGSATPALASSSFVPRTRHLSLDALQRARVLAGRASSRSEARRPRDSFVEAAASSTIEASN